MTNKNSQYLDLLDFEDDIKILANNNTYEKLFRSDINLEYSFADSRLKELLYKHNLEEIAGSGNEFAKMLRLTLYVATKLKFGEVSKFESFHALDIFEKVHKGFVSNCFIAATVLTECFLSMGFFARMVRCMPIDLRFRDCHCVTIVKSNIYDKFIAFDAAMGGYYVDSNGIPLNIYEIRNSLINNREFKLRSVFKIKQADMKKYLAKNMIRFQTHEVSKYGNEIFDKSITMINLNPLTLPISNKKRVVNNLEINEIYIYNDKQFWGL